MLNIPQLSAPLTKSIRTLEGQLIAGLAFLTAITSAIDPSSLTHTEAAVLITIQGGALTAQRGLLKGIALLKNVGVEPATAPDIAEPLAHVTATVKDLQAQVAHLDTLKVTLDGDSHTLLKQIEDRFKALGDTAKADVATVKSDVEHDQAQAAATDATVTNTTITPVLVDAPAPVAESPFVEVPEPEETIVKPQSALTPDPPVAPAPVLPPSVPVQA